MPGCRHLAAAGHLRSPEAVRCDVEPDNGRRAAAAAQGKRVQALGGAKNHLIVMDDADIPKAGERRLAGSVLVPVGEAAGRLLELLVARTKGMSVGNSTQAGVDMGPLVTSTSRRASRRARLRWSTADDLRSCDSGDDDRDGRDLRPVLSVIRVKTLDEAIELVNRSSSGNATAIFTQSGKSAREYSSRCEVGMD